MKAIVNIIQAGRRPYWRDDGDTLNVFVGEDLDEFTQRRYVKQAEAEHLGKPARRRRRRLLPLAVPEMMRHAVGAHHHAALALVGTAAAVGLVATSATPFVVHTTPPFTGERQVVNATSDHHWQRTTDTPTSRHSQSPSPASASSADSPTGQSEPITPDRSLPPQGSDHQKPTRPVPAKIHTRRGKGRPAKKSAHGKPPPGRMRAHFPKPVHTPKRPAVVSRHGPQKKTPVR